MSEFISVRRPGFSMLEDAGYLHALVGQAGAGKTNLALRWAIEQALLGVQTYFLSLDEGRDEMARRVAALGLGHPANMTLLESKSRELSELALGNLKSRSLLVLDYVQIIRVRHPENTALSLARFAIDQRICVLAVSRLNVLDSDKTILASTLARASKTVWKVGHAGKVLDLLKSDSN